MPLNKEDQELNENRLQPVIDELKEYYFGAQSAIRKLEFLKATTLALFNDNEEILQLDDRLYKDLARRFMRLIGSDDQAFMRRMLHGWVMHYKQQEIAKRYDISEAIQHDVPADSKTGSAKDFKNALHAVLKTPMQASDPVVILTPLDRTKKAVDGIEFDKLLANSITPVLANNITKKILIPVLCEFSTWRLIIIDIDKNSKLKKATLWDPIHRTKPVFGIDASGVMGVRYDPDTDRLRKENVFKDMRTVAQGLNSKIKEKNIVPYVSTKLKESKSHLSMNYVIRKALQIVADPGWQELCQEKKPERLQLHVHGLIRNRLRFFESQPAPVAAVDAKGKHHTLEAPQAGFHPRK